MKRKDLTGKVFGKLTVMGFAGSKKTSHGTRPFWNCLCECGITKEILSINLMSGTSTSCGCIRIKNMTTHSMSKTPEYRAWQAMRQRCSNKKDKRYKDYGGRGIKVCKRWDSFENFISDMGKKTSLNHSIDRVDNDGNYEPKNCRWATRKQQQNNRRNTK